MSKTIRVFKLATEFIDSPDGTDSYEMPNGWRSITTEELALSQFNNESPEFIERRRRGATGGPHVFAGATATTPRIEGAQRA